MEKITQTAGRDQLGGFAPDFAHYNDDILFGENWNNQDIDLKTRCMITVVALMASGITDSSLKYHLENAKAHGVTRPEMAAIVTHVGFYVGWPKAWAVFRMAKEVYLDDGEQEQHGGFFGQGEPNTAYRQYFVGNSYLKPLTDAKDTSVFIANVTFEPGCRNNWHIHRARSGGGQILICVDGEGWYQEEGKPARSLKPGDVVTIPAGVKHWHGAKADCWFSHLAVECPGEDTSNEWMEPVADEIYRHLSTMP